MAVADQRTYLAELVSELMQQWPDNRVVNIVCHGHSVPAGYFATPDVRTFDAYPHLMHLALKQRFPFAALNVIVTAIGGEHSESGAQRFERDVLTHRPDVLTLDYALNDRRLGLERAEAAWRTMIEQALAANVKVMLLTPTPDITGQTDPGGESWTSLQQHAEQVRRLADEYGTALVDSLAAFEAYQQREGTLADLLSWANHPNRAGHELVARHLLRWFPLE